MPNRFIRESCRTSPTLDQLSGDAERLFWRLTTVADDFGRFECDTRIILANCFPLRVGKLKPMSIGKWFEELRSSLLVQTYDDNGKHYGFFTTWDKYQVTRANKSKFPDPTPENICMHPHANASVFESVSDIRNSNTITMSGYRADAKELLEFLNDKAGRRFELNGSNLDVVIARLKEPGRTKEQLRLMVARKIVQWETDEKMAMYLRPATLFNKTKCAQYLGEE